MQLYLGWQVDLLKRLQRPTEVTEALGGTNQSLNLSVGYGISSRFAVELTAPFAYKQQQVLQATGEQGREVHGVADPLLLFKSTIIGSEAVNPRALRVGVAAGVKVPLGESGAKDASGVLPQAFQISSGAWDAVLAGYFSVGAFDKGSVLGSAFARLPTTNSRGYRFGSSASGSVDIQVVHLFPLVVAAGGRALWMLPDSSPVEHVHASGGGQVSAHLGLGWNPGGSWFLTGDVLVPVLRQLSGNQMALQQAFTLAVRTEL